MTEENHALEQAKAQYSSICEMVAALNVDYDRLADLKDELETTHADQGGEASFEVWLKADCDEIDSPTIDDSNELSELLAAANNCENQDSARDRIQEDPLSVEVRSGWYNPGNASSPDEFQILLCTGGPAVRIMGELDEHGRPVRAWLEHQDWGTPWTQFFGASQDTLLAYAREFYFGG